MTVKCETCEDGEYFPYYGLAPHAHDIKRINDRMAISTAFASKDAWPANFKEDPEAPGCGIWSCPDCSAADTQESA